MQIRDWVPKGDTAFLGLHNNFPQTWCEEFIPKLATIIYADLVLYKLTELLIPSLFQMLGSCIQFFYALLKANFQFTIQVDNLGMKHNNRHVTNCIALSSITLGKVKVDGTDKCAYSWIFTISCATKITLIWKHSFMATFFSSSTSSHVL